MGVVASQIVVMGAGRFGLVVALGVDVTQIVVMGIRLFGLFCVDFFVVVVVVVVVEHVRLFGNIKQVTNAVGEVVVGNVVMLVTWWSSEWFPNGPQRNRTAWFISFSMPPLLSVL